MYRLTIQYETPADPAAFDKQYFGRHVALVARIPGLRATTYSKPKVVGPGTAPYLVAELDFADEDAYQAAKGSQEQVAAARDSDALPAERLMFVGGLSDS